MLAAGCALAVSFAAPAFAETQNVKVSGSLDAYYFYRHNFDLRDNNDAGAVAVGTTVPAGGGGSGSTTNRSEGDSFFMSITQLQVNADLTNNVSTVINVINQRDWNADLFNTTTGPTRTAGDNRTDDEFDIILDLAYAQMKEIFYAPLTLTIGRQDIVLGRGFIVGWNPQDPSLTIQADEFTQVQSFDAIRATLDFSPWTLDLIYSKINENSHNPEDDRDLYIAYLNYKFAEYNAVADAYFMTELDRATVLSAGAGSKTNETDIIGARAQFDPISQITLGAEWAYQFGDYFGSVTTPQRERDAWGLDLFGEYRFDHLLKPVAGLQYVYLSGETETQGTGGYGAWNGAFRLPVYGWIRDYQEVNYATSQGSDQPAGQNQQHISLYGTLTPMDDLKLSLNYWRFWTTDDVLTVAGELNSARLNDHIGDEVNLLATWIYTEDVTFNFFANWFVPGDHFLTPSDETASEYISEVKVVF